MHQQLSHPHVVRLLGHLEDERFMYHIMPRYRMDLFTYFMEVRAGRLEEPEVARLMAELLSGLVYLHEEKGLAHRDLKLENLLLDDRGALHIADFGLASQVRPGKLFTRACGSPAYTAPEVLEGQPYHGPRADLYSAGVIMFCLLAGRFPYPDPVAAARADPVHGVERLRALMRANRTAPLPAHVSPAARALCLHLLQAAPRSRPELHVLLAHPFLHGQAALARAASLLRAPAPAAATTAPATGASFATLGTSTGAQKRMPPPTSPRSALALALSMPRTVS